MSESTWIAWNPPSIEHVSGKFTQRVLDAETGMPEPQTVHADCRKCGAHWEGSCLTGRVRDHIQRFALVHAHRDPFDASSK